jgi:hypothetical protein
MRKLVFEYFWDHYDEDYILRKLVSPGDQLKVAILFRFRPVFILSQFCREKITRSLFVFQNISGRVYLRRSWAQLLSDFFNAFVGKAN